MIKFFLFLLLMLVPCIWVQAQIDFDEAIKLGDNERRLNHIKEAVKYYYAAKAYAKLSNNNEQLKQADSKLDDLDKIAKKAVNDAKKNFLEAQKQKNNAKKSDSLKTVYAAALDRQLEITDTQKEEINRLLLTADSSLKAIEEAKKISDANGLMYEAQGLVKYDPTLALHLAHTALAIVNSIKVIKVDSTIIDKANRIYYENNFSNTLFLKQKDSLGNITNATYVRDDLWTITDAPFAIKWSLKGELIKKVKLDKPYNRYVFRFSADSQILVHGYNGNSTSFGTVWDIDNDSPEAVLLDSFKVNSLNINRDTVAFALNDTTKGWERRLFVFGYKAFQLTGNGKLVPIIKGIRTQIQLIAFSPNGKYVATYGQKVISILDIKGKYLGQITANTGNIAESLDFSPDSKMLLVRQPNSLQLYKIRTDSNGVDFVVKQEELYFAPLALQTFKISPDSKSILVSCKSGMQQVVQVYRYNNEKSKYQLFSQFKCPGSSQTSAVFSTDESGILSSSDKLRLWKILSEPKTLDTKSEPIWSIEYDGKNSLYNAYAYNNNLLKYSPDGLLIAYDSSGTSGQTQSATLRLVSFLPTEKVLIVSEDGNLKMYNKKVPLDAFLDGFHFEAFTSEQRKKYGLYKNE